MELMPHQERAVELLGNGQILWGGVGTGKSFTAMEYYARKEAPRPVVVITTADKRDSLDWMKEGARVRLSPSLDNFVVESWQNIGKFVDYEDHFFIFDEQKLVGRGAWVKAFMKIAKRNRWIMLTATPGDTWMDYAAIFIANGWYRNISDFRQLHVVYEPHSKYPKIKGYIGVRKLEVLRSRLLVEMPFVSHTNRIRNYMTCEFDSGKLEQIYKKRWNVYDDKPVVDISEMWRLMRRVVNSDPSRLETLRTIMKMHPRVIVFYNFNYELDMLRALAGEIDVFEKNGHKKDPTPTGDRWLYAVQYNSGAEAWNCTTTDALCMFSMNYSYKVFEQVQGRIDRLDTPYTELYYYIFTSDSVVDKAIRRALSNKQTFNESAFLINPWAEEPLDDSLYAIFE